MQRVTRLPVPWCAWVYRVKIKYASAAEHTRAQTRTRFHEIFEAARGAHHDVGTVWGTVAFLIFAATRLELAPV